MNTLTPPGNPGQNARALLKILQERFPVFREYSPLVIGIDKKLLELLPDVDRKTLRVALGMHTHSLRYLKAMEKASHRLDLDGNAGAEVMATHRSHATEVLRERLRKDAERRQVQRELEAQERQRSEKLRQLVEKFDRNR